MPRIRALHVVAVAALVGLAACSKDSTAPSLINDSQVVTDVAATAGDAIATDVGTLLGNETAAALPAPAVGFELFGANADTLVWARTKTCYDSTSTVVANCLPLSAVRSIAFHVTVNGTHTGANFTANLHRVRDWTLTRVFTGATETSRRHDGVGTGSDTTVVTGPALTRTHDVTGLDSTIAVVFDLPRSTNPWPASGMMVRHETLHVTFASATASVSKDYSKRVEVDFPADAQGNVVLKIDALTCNLNLVTRAVTACH